MPSAYNRAAELRRHAAEAQAHRQGRQQAALNHLAARRTERQQAAAATDAAAAAYEAQRASFAYLSRPAA